LERIQNKFMDDLFEWDKEKAVTIMETIQPGIWKDTG